MTNLRKQIAGAAKIGLRPKESEDHPANINVYEDGTYFKAMDIDLIQPDMEQPRKFFDPEALQDLANSIKEKGVIQPIIIRRDEEANSFILVAGERRWRASKIAGLKEIPAILKTQDNALEISLIENLQRENLNPIDEAEALARMLKNHHYTQDKLSKVLGKARTTITEMLTLNRLPDEIKEKCRNNNLFSRRLLLEVAKQGDPADQAPKLNLFKKIQEGGYKSDAVREMTRKKKEKTIRSQGEIMAGKVVGLSSSLEKLNLNHLDTESKGKFLLELQKLKILIDNILK